MIKNQFIYDKFGFLGDDLLVELQCHSVITKIKSKTEIIREGQKNKYIPFLINGAVKVLSLDDGKEFVYYYLRPNDCCLMTFSTIFTDCISKVYAITEKESEFLFLPISVVQDWLIKYPQINKVFYSEYNQRFLDIISMMNDAVFNKLDKRIINYIRQQVDITGNNPVKLTHKEIANSLGSSREVISRILKKIEITGEISQTKEGIKLSQIIL
ncbi:Crp/Fnr family transcriptional regulator [Chryseobacterium nematophagum]|uniref:Crp/Fnr family transcriptional regulator n=1 Tax=Chryseobacterium nematophagum TaxID=2305228 RepID=A0A3M7TJ43_9FLAO|nr:Crp/Fnr family transcriptional regulator [Chryseobacterium nematophagum]RNA63465.1 Crp/Fnr family transcriptional regulator [Chryseobacterium nematophagum]